MDVFTAAGSGESDRVRALVEQDAALVHAVDRYGWTPLVWAVKDSCVEVPRYLLDHGAAVNYRDPSGWTVLHHAFYRSHPGVFLLLLERGADVTAVDNRGATPLMCAPNEATVRMLLAHGGSDVDAADHRGRTACHQACINGNSGKLRQLLEAGADPTLRDAQGYTALGLASYPRRDDCLSVYQEWRQAYVLLRARGIRDATSCTPPAASFGL